MRQLKWLRLCVLALLVVYILAGSMAAQLSKPQQPSSSNSPSYWDDPSNWQQQFVPDWRPFWDNSKNWTTNYGPAYRDTIESPSQMLGCSTQFALCFSLATP